MKHVSSYHKGHPNPTIYRDDYILLDGEWDFVFDEEDIGTEQRYFENFPIKTQKINVPFAYQCVSSGINKPNYICDTIWYKKTFEIKDLSKNYIIHFLGVDYKCYVYLNGELIATHEGGYDGFTVELTNVTLGVNTIVLKVVDGCDADQLRGKQAWRLNNFTCFYTRTSGIYKSVYLESVNKNYIKYFSLNGDFKTKQVALHIEPKNYLDTKVVVSFSNKRFSFDLSSLINDFYISLDEIIPWEPLNPYLYDAKIELIEKGNVVDSIDTYFGFKSIECREGKIFVNNRDTYLKLVLDQHYNVNGLTTATEDEMVKDIQLMVKAGFNGFRAHQFVPDPLMFYYADIYGLLVWQEVPSAAYYTYKTNRNCYREIPLQIKEHFTHPCIMAYTLFNESWGINEIAESKEIQQFTVDMVNFVRPMVKDRLLISNDGWYHTTSDLLTMHNYCNTSELLNKDLPFDLLDRLFNKENPDIIKDYRKCYAGDYRYHGEPILLSEFFGVSLKDDTNGDNWGYGLSAKNGDDLLRFLTDQLDYISSHTYYRGFCLTQLTDVQQEVNGLFTKDRVCKCDINKIKNLMESFK